MIRPTGPLRDLTGVSPEIAWKLTDAIFQQASSLIIAVAVFVLLGSIGFFSSGSFWYLAASLFFSANGVWCLTLMHRYRTSRGTYSPKGWAIRGMVSGWIAAAGWGGLSIVILFEPNRTFVLMVMAVQSATAIGAAVRNCAVRSVAAGQIYLTLIPLFCVCLMSGNVYFLMYAGFVVLHLVAAVSLMNFLHAQTMRLLVQDEEKTALVTSLEATRQELEIINQHLETLASTDALTGVANRRTFDLALSREWARSAREAAPLSLLLLDVDRFKAFNDFYGHPAGDTCLCTIAAIVSSVAGRPGDAVARYGGEEFAVILPNTKLDGAATIAQAICEAIRAAEIPHDASDGGQVTVSIGVACLMPVQGTAPAQLAMHADAALYAAKRAGRNRIHAAGDCGPIHGSAGAAQSTGSPLRV